MKTKALMCVLFFFVVFLASVVSFAADEKKFSFYEPSDYEEFYGTWVNTKYSGRWSDGGGHRLCQKLVDYRWGSFDFYTFASDKTPFATGSSIIVDKWSDNEGNTCYKLYSRMDKLTGVLYVLERVSKDGKVKELVYQRFDFPSENDLNSKNVSTYTHYRIYYRQ
jgi:hypothetical protein